MLSSLLLSVFCLTKVFVWNFDQNPCSVNEAGKAFGQCRFWPDSELKSLSGAEGEFELIAII